MNWWCMIISGLIVVVLKVAGVTLFLLYFPQIFGKCNDSCSPTGSYGTVPQIFGNGNDSFSPTESYGTVCPSRWDFHQGRCFFFSTSEMSWNKSRDLCEAQGSTLAIVNTPEKLEYSLNLRIFSRNSLDLKNLIQNVKFLARKTMLCRENLIKKFLQVIAGAEKYFIGLLYQQATKRWHWINNSVFNGNITNQIQNFNCVTIGLTNTFDAASCDVSHRYICEKRAK